MADTDKTRIQKVLSGAGVASRRNIEEMVLEGRITVNHKAVTKLPFFVVPGDEIRVDGKRIRLGSGKKVYYLLNKPKGIVCTQKDELGRRRAVDYIPPIGKRVYCVGRLDADSSGLIILTNDGEFTNEMTHPKHGVTKTYVVEVDGRISGDDVDKLKKGVWVGGSRTERTAIKILARNPRASLLEIHLSEGRNRQIRRMLVRLGHKVKKLKRTAIGPITDRGLKAGSCRPLKISEVTALKRLAAKGKRVAPK